MKLVVHPAAQKEFDRKVDYLRKTDYCLMQQICSLMKSGGLWNKFETIRAKAEPSVRATITGSDRPHGSPTA